MTSNKNSKFARGGEKQAITHNRTFTGCHSREEVRIKEWWPGDLWSYFVSIGDSGVKPNRGFAENNTFWCETNQTEDSQKTHSSVKPSKQSIARKYILVWNQREYIVSWHLSSRDHLPACIWLVYRLFSFKDLINDVLCFIGFFRFFKTLLLVIGFVFVSIQHVTLKFKHWILLSAPLGCLSVFHWRNIFISFGVLLPYL